MPFFSVGYFEGKRLEVTFLSTPANKLTEGYDWVSAIVNVEVDGFKGEVEIQITVSDMARFKEQLEPVYNSLVGIAEFKTIEDQLYIRVEVDKLGHIRTTGYLKGNLYTDSKLYFDIHYDQTLLWHTISEIDKAIYELSQITN